MLAIVYCLKCIFDVHHIFRVDSAVIFRFVVNIVALLLFPHFRTNVKNWNKLNGPLNSTLIW
jgi:hypothetical protein